VTFALTYDSGTNLATYRVDDSTPLTYHPTTGFTDIFIRTEAAKSNSSISIDNLVLNGVAIDDRASAGANTPLDILRISDVASSFTLTGRSTMSWIGDPQNPVDGTAPHQSQLAYQIKVGTTSPTNPTSVPEPTLTLALLAFVTFGAGWRFFKD
jgi:hypothetical protein